MDWNYLKYFYYENKKLIWIYLIFLLIVIFIGSVFIQMKDQLQMQKLTTTTTYQQTTDTTVKTQVVPIKPTATTIDPRVKYTRRKYQMGLYCSVPNDCTGNKHPLCNGFWGCEDNECMWYCWA